MAMCAMCFCVFLSIFNLARKSAPCVLRVFVFFPGPRTDNQCVLCVVVYFLTKLSNLGMAKPRRVSCVFVFFPTPTKISCQIERLSLIRCIEERASPIGWIQYRCCAGQCKGPHVPTTSMFGL